MHQELLRHSPLLILPLVATFLFLAVWVASAVRAMTESREAMAEKARIPLASEDRHEHG